MQTHKVTSFPVVLLGTRYWGGLFDWLRTVVLPDGKVSARDLDIFHLTDDVSEAVSIVVQAREEHLRGTSPDESQVTQQDEPHRSE